MPQKVITLDGPAGSGKSTVARLLAQQLNFKQLDSGAFYRTFTYLACRATQNGSTPQGAAGDPIEELLKTAEFQSFVESAPIEVTFDGARQILAHDNVVMENHIRTPEITAKIKPVADCLYVRHRVNDLIRGLAQRYPLVADGRDMGTVVFPDTPYKFFLTASLDVRAERRLAEFQEKTPGISLEEVKRQIGERDNDDSAREFGGLAASKDAIYVDTTTLKINAVVLKIENLIRKIDSNNDSPDNQS